MRTSSRGGSQVVPTGSRNQVKSPSVPERDGVDGTTSSGNQCEKREPVGGNQIDAKSPALTAGGAANTVGAREEGPGWVMHRGDCLAGLAQMAADSVDVVITDPPYEAEAHTKQRRVKRDGVCETESLPFSAITKVQRLDAARHMARVTRRWLLIFCQVEASVEWATAVVASPGWEYVRTMVWVKPDAMPQFTGDRPGMGYESIVVCHRRGRKRWNGGGRTGVFWENKNAGRANGEPTPHPTTKPLPLMRELVSLFSDPGELILDPFAGSGSTLVAATQLDRSAIGWELNADYFDIACRRLRGERAKPLAHQPELF